MKQFTILKRFLALLITLLLLFTLASCKKRSETSQQDHSFDQVEENTYIPSIPRLFNAIKEIESVSNNKIDTCIIVDGNDNKLFLIAAKDLEIIKQYDISASKYGYGSERGSNKTPWGVHVIDSMYGDGAPLGMCFYDRRPTGEIATIYTDTTNISEDPVTSRIIWLKGLEEINATSYWRFVYIHGTHEEGLLGTPQSKGCIRLSNENVIELFELVHPGTYVNIVRPEKDILLEE
jgi:hypothetical protein